MTTNECGWEKIARDLYTAMELIVKCPEGDVCRYVAKVDSIALVALVNAEFAMEDLRMQPGKPMSFEDFMAGLNAAYGPTREWERENERQESKL